MADTKASPLALHPAMAACGSFLRLDRRPIDARWRFREVPARYQVVRRVARVWIAQTGTDELLLRHLRNRTVTDAMIASPTPAELREFLTAELPRAEHRLAEVLDGYWESEWRGAHRGHGTHPEHHLWRAADAARSIREALAGLDG